MTGRPERVVLMRDPYNEPSEQDMKFRLTYEGLLLGSSRTDTRARHKHEIRKRFHRQLAHLWQITPALRNRRHYPKKDLKEVLQNDSEPWVDALAKRYARNGYNFVPLILEGLSLSCGVDVLFLRPDSPGSLVKSGDIDNRLKTLFDALRIPQNLGELGGYDEPADDENPFFCLLEDDKLITQIAVETDVLHEPTGDAYDVNDARLVITVTMRPAIVSMENLDFV